MKVKIKKLTKVPTPSKAYESDLCYDCVAVSEEELAPNVWKYKLGIAFQIERNRECIGSELFSESGRDIWFDFSLSDINLSIDARPRSSVWETGMVLSNCEGTIDEGYIGEVSAVFYHVMPNMPRYKVGDKVCQIKLGFTLPIEFEEVSELDNTIRGAKGYGSSGK